MEPRVEGRSELDVELGGLEVAASKPEGSLRDFAARCDDFSLEMLNAVERQPAATRMADEVRR